MLCCLIGSFWFVLCAKSFLQILTFYARSSFYLWLFMAFIGLMPVFSRKFFEKGFGEVLWWFCPTNASQSQHGMWGIANLLTGKYGPGNGTGLQTRMSSEVYKRDANPRIRF